MNSSILAKPPTLIAFNKAYGVLSQFRFDEKYETLSTFFKNPELRIAGRLDVDSEGLLLLTDNGKLNQYISHPRFKQQKTYLVEVEGDISEHKLDQLRHGIMLKDGPCLPAEVQQVEAPAWLWQRDPPIRFRAAIPTYWLQIKIQEGRNRQVRRMTAAVGLPTLRLIRTSIGSILLAPMQLGEHRIINLLDHAEFKDFSKLKAVSNVKAKAGPKTNPRFNASSKQRTNYKNKQR